MERLTAADAWFLYLEGPTVPLHVTGLLLLDPSTASDGFTFANLRRHLLSRIDLIPAMRRRLVEVPLGIDHPCWVEDPEFDVDRHMHRHLLDGTRDTAELQRFVGDFAAKHLDRGRPLWDLVLVEGLSDGRVAVLLKMHHCTVDGVSGMDVIVSLLDFSPTPERYPVSVDWMPGRVPTSLEVIAGATWSRLSQPLRPVRALADAAHSVGQIAGTSIRRRLSGADVVAHPLNAPRTRFNASLSRERSVVFGQVPLDDFKIIRAAFGVTVNDVVLAACTSGLRSYLEACDTVPNRSLVCSVPVSTHGNQGLRESAHAANQVSTMFVNLPVHLADPLEQLTHIHAGSLGAKEVQSAVSADMIGDLVDLIPISLFNMSTLLYSQARFADRFAPVHNVVVSNVVGSAVPVYLAGAKLVGMFPFGPLMEGAGLNVTVLSNEGVMNIGMLACPSLVPNSGDLLDWVVEGVALLRSAAEGVG